MSSWTAEDLAAFREAEAIDRANGVEYGLPGVTPIPQNGHDETANRSGRQVQLTPASAIRSEAHPLVIGPIDSRSKPLRCRGREGDSAEVATHERACPPRPLVDCCPASLRARRWTSSSARLGDWRSVVQAATDRHMAPTWTGFIDSSSRMPTASRYDAARRRPDPVPTRSNAFAKAAGPWARRRRSNRSVFSRLRRTHRDASVRRALAPLAALADTLDLVVLVVAHLTKDESSTRVHRVTGSGAVRQ